MFKILSRLLNTFSYLGHKDGTLRLRAVLAIAFFAAALAGIVYGGEDLMKDLGRAGGVPAIGAFYGGIGLCWWFLLNWANKRAEELGL
ncbi:MAG: hypothetical protein AAFU77_04850 [Myxococcota bacterium]